MSNDYQCSRCQQKPAEVCHECVRALALKWFGAIARHPEADASCRMCEQGLPQYCGGCFIEEVSEYRALLRTNGTWIGEPRPRNEQARALLVAEHWHRQALARRDDGDDFDIVVSWTAMAHVLNLVLAALRGEVDPVELGIPADHPDAQILEALR
jgi:hypothetical protein